MLMSQFLNLSLICTPTFHCRIPFDLYPCWCFQSIHFPVAYLGVCAKMWRSEQRVHSANSEQLQKFKCSNAMFMFIYHFFFVPLYNDSILIRICNMFVLHVQDFCFMKKFDNSGTIFLPLQKISVCINLS